MSCQFSFGQVVNIVALTLWCHKCGEPNSLEGKATFTGHENANGQTVDIFSIDPHFCSSCNYAIPNFEKPCGGGGITHPLLTESVHASVQRREVIE